MTRGSCQNPLILQDLAKESKVNVVPDSKGDSTLSNIIAGHVLMQLDRFDEIHVAVGVLPQSTQAPSGSATTWSV